MPSQEEDAALLEGDAAEETVALPASHPAPPHVEPVLYTASQQEDAMAELTRMLRVVFNEFGDNTQLAYTLCLDALTPP